MKTDFKQLCIIPAKCLSEFTAVAMYYSNTKQQFSKDFYKNHVRMLSPLEQFEMQNTPAQSDRLLQKKNGREPLMELEGFIIFRTSVGGGKDYLGMTKQPYFKTEVIR